MRTVTKTPRLVHYILCLVPPILRVLFHTFYVLVSVLFVIFHTCKILRLTVSALLTTTHIPRLLAHILCLVSQIGDLFEGSQLGALQAVRRMLRSGAKPLETRVIGPALERVR